MPYRDKEIEKKYYSISEVADIFNVAPSLIRFWEKEFNHIRPKKNRKGNRQFTNSDIEDVRMVYRLVKEQGYTLDGARDVIKNQYNKVRNQTEMVENLKKIRSFLQQLKDNL